MSHNSFDDRAATWDDDPSHVERASLVAAAIGDALVLDPSVRVLEYGAGTGLVSQALRPSVGPITMADTSAGMRDVMQSKLDAGVITDARIWDADLAAGPVPAGEQRFDLVVTVLALHHIHDLDTVLANFAALLPDGGHVAIVDLEEEDGSFHPEGFDGHHGFSRTQLAADLEAAGFSDVVFRPCHQLVRHGHPYDMFLATASRATG